MNLLRKTPTVQIAWKKCRPSQEGEGRKTSGRRIHTLLSRLRKRLTVFQSEADIAYIMQMCEAYDAFFRRYKGNVVTIDTTTLGYEEQITKFVRQVGV
jgi:hypothetical protein